MGWTGGPRPSEPVPETIGRHDPIDVEAEGTHAFVWLAVLIAFLVSTLFVWNELRYAVLGKSAEASVLRTYHVTGRHGTYYFVEYEYRGADGRPVTDNDGISPDWPAPSSGKVNVTYVSGESSSSRLAGHRHYVPILFFIACLAALGFAAVKWWREGEDAARYMNRKDD